MQVTVSARHMDVSPALREAVVEKIGRLERFFSGLHLAEVHFSEEPTRRHDDREMCEVILTGSGQTVCCKVTAADPFAAIDVAYGKLEHQLHKVKTKLLNRYHGGDKKSPVKV